MTFYRYRLYGGVLIIGFLVAAPYVGGIVAVMADRVALALTMFSVFRDLRFV